MLFMLFSALRDGLLQPMCEFEECAPLRGRNAPSLRLGVNHREGTKISPPGVLRPPPPPRAVHRIGCCTGQCGSSSWGKKSSQTSAPKSVFHLHLQRSAYLADRPRSVSVGIRLHPWTSVFYARMRVIEFAHRLQQRPRTPAEEILFLHLWKPAVIRRAAPQAHLRVICGYLSPEPYGRAGHPHLSYNNPHEREEGLNPSVLPPGFSGTPGARSALPGTFPGAGSSALAGTPA